MSNILSQAKHSLPIVVVGVFALALSFVILPQIANAATLFSDQFEQSGSSIVAPWNVDGDVTRASKDGDKAVKLNGSDDTEHVWTSVNTTGYTNIHLLFDRKIEGFDDDDELFDVWYNVNGTWYAEGSTGSNSDGWTAINRTLEQASNDSDITIRFRIEADNRNDIAWVDNVQVTGDPLPPATINAQKVICDNESDLPNWGDGEPAFNITSNTAQRWVNSHPGCHLADWKFQLAPDWTGNHGDNTGIAGGAW
ncbi:MAG: hypothetical protein NUV82_03630, partial [Candidatus Komeilibacteria bacterium]|nr:hypothetical protein [Candidatus Komeilibacteria bacterium]